MSALCKDRVEKHLSVQVPDYLSVCLCIQLCICLSSVGTTCIQATPYCKGLTTIASLLTCAAHSCGVDDVARSLARNFPGSGFRGFRDLNQAAPSPDESRQG